MRQRRPAIAGRRDFVGPEIKAPPPDVGGGAVGASLGGDCFPPFLLQPMQIIGGAPRVRGGGTAGLAGAATLAPRGDSAGEPARQCPARHAGEHDHHPAARLEPGPPLEPECAEMILVTARGQSAFGRGDLPKTRSRPSGVNINPARPFSRPVHGHTPAKARAGTVKWFGGRFAEAVGSSSHLTPRWREMDSNFRFRCVRRS